MYEQFFVLFGIIFTGYILRKLKVINEEMNTGLNKFIVYFAYPCLLILNISSLDITKGLMVDFFWMLLITGACFVVYSAISYFYGKYRKFPVRAANVAEAAMTAPNDGFMGFPVALIFFGEKGLFLMMAHNVILNVYFFTWCIHAMGRNKGTKGKITLKNVILGFIKLILNPNILAMIIGFVLALVNVPITGAAQTYFDMIGSIATPMAMVFIGSTLAGSNILDMFKNHIVWESAIMKLIILPIITVAIVFFLPISSIMKASIVLGCCFPTGATVVMLAEQEKQNHKLASKILFFTTILSMATIPCGIGLIEMIF